MRNLTRPKTVYDEQQLKPLEACLDDSVNRLDAAVAESRRLSKEMDDLQTRDRRQMRQAPNARFNIERRRG